MLIKKCYTIPMRLFKTLILRILARSVTTFFLHNPHIKLVAVVGSVGKTTTKSTIVDILNSSNKVRTNRGNFNAELSAPLEILGVDSPRNPRSVWSWWSVLRQARRSARRQHDVDIIVQEFGIDHPGEMTAFGRYIRPDITIVTAISPEHMEFFGSLETVAREEFALAEFSEKVVYNRDDIRPEFVDLADCGQLVSYGTELGADYQMAVGTFTNGKGFRCQLVHADQTSRPFVIPVVGTHQLRVAAGAAAVALELGLDIECVMTALEKLTPVSGRMNPLPGLNDSIIIDDSYNSSPLAVKSALNTLYRLPAKTKIAILGDMNELGETTADEHAAVGARCDPKQLNHVVTIGHLAEQYLAPAARKNGCTVTSFAKATDAAQLLPTLAKKDTILLFKGSQGDIYLEEAIKPLLKHAADSQKLVRQSDTWLEKKRQFFESNH